MRAISGIKPGGIFISALIALSLACVSASWADNPKVRMPAEFEPMGGSDHQLGSVTWASLTGR